MRIVIIGGGLAGCEAAYMIARHGIPVELYEMKPRRFSPAHQSEGLAELVCSNSLGTEGEHTAPGLLKLEMKALRSLVLQAAEYARVPAGRALGVDRDKFSEWITKTISSHSNIMIRREECETVPEADLVIVATGPLTSDSLAKDLAGRIGSETLYFYDSISPIIAADSIDYTKAFYASRYEEGDDYLNCPLDRTQYEAFVGAIVAAEKVPVRSFEVMKCFESCLPVEVLAERGLKTLAFGPMKPVGLLDPKTGQRPYAVLQLRRENQPTTLYNMVGFQSRMKWGEQSRIFRTIPGLENAEFVRFGSMHRNTYIDSPSLLQPDLSLKTDPRILIAGQLTGVEGYVESAAMGQWAGLVAVAKAKGERVEIPPPESAIGALIRAITTRPLHGGFAPMNINFGLLPILDPNEKLKKEERRERMVHRALAAAGTWKEGMAFHGRN